VAKIHLWPICIAMTLMVLSPVFVPHAAIAFAEKPQDDRLSAARSLLQRGKNREAILLLKAVAASQPDQS
jgi:hypothetical protein